MWQAVAKGVFTALPYIFKAHDALNMVDDAINVIKTDAEKLARTFGGRWYEMNDIAFKTARTMAMSREEAVRYNEHLIKSTKELAANFGVTAKELAEFQKSYSEAVGRNVVLAREQLAQMSTLSKITDDATAAQLVDEFDKIGVSIQGTTAHVGLLQEKAKLWGINSTKASKTLASNIKLASSYSFRNGVADIEKMALKAASMRVDIEAIMRSSEKFTNLEDAIGTSAQLQMLGGSFTQFAANPFTQMYNALADPDKYMDEVLKAFKPLGTYNEKNGQVTVNPLNAMLGKQAAQTLGVDFGDMMRTVTNQIKNEAVMRQLGAKQNEFSEDEKVALQNLARGNFNQVTGKYEVNILGADGRVAQTVAVEDMTKDMLKLAQDSQITDSNMQVDVRNIRLILEQTYGRAKETKSMKEGVEGTKSWWDATITDWQDNYMPIFSGWFNKFTNWLGGNYANGGIVRPVAHAAEGAVVPGTSYTGDHVPVMANSGEMILNYSQQAALFSSIKSLQKGYSVKDMESPLAKVYEEHSKKIIKILKESNLDFKTFTRKAKLDEYLPKLLDSSKALRSELATALSDTGKSFWDALKAEFKPLLEALKGAKNALSKMLTTTKEWASKQKTKVAEKARGLYKSAGDVVRRAKEAVKPTYNKVKEKVVGAGTKVFNKAKGIYNSAKNIAGAVKKKIEPTIIKIKERATELGTKAKQRVTGAYKSVTGFLSKTKDKVAKRITGAKDAVTGFAKRVGGKAVAKVNKAASYVAGKAKNIGGYAKGAGKFVAKKAGLIGTAVTTLFAGRDIYKENEKFKKQEQEIKRKSISSRDKAKAIDKAKTQRNENIGGIAGEASGGLAGAFAGGKIGAAIGTAIAPGIGTAIGGIIGSIGGAIVGSYAGKSTGKAVGRQFKGGAEEEWNEKSLVKNEKGTAVPANSKKDENSALITNTAKEKFDENSLPHAAHGIVVPGDSKQGDKTPVMANAEEMILDKAKQVRLLGMIENLPKVQQLQPLGQFNKVAPVSVESKSLPSPKLPSTTNINLNVSGTIKLDAGDKFANLDISKLLESTEFKRQLLDVITKGLNENSNGGRRNLESERNNMASQYNRAGK